MKRVILAILLLAALLESREAAAQRVIHRVRFGETLSTLSKHYYGNRDYAHLIAMANGLAGPKDKPSPGSYIRVPTAWLHTVRRPTTLGALASRLLGDRRRWPALALINKVGGRRRRVPANTRVVIPFTLPYQAQSGDTFTALAERFYGTKKYAGLIASFNFIRDTAPPVDTQLEIPFGVPKIRAELLEELVNQRLLGIDPSSGDHQRQKLQEANALIRKGSYWEVPLQLTRLLARDSQSDTLAAEAFKLLAVAYVAIGQQALAIQSFQEALLRRPTLHLNVVNTSPKVIRAFMDAKLARRKP